MPVISPNTARNWKRLGVDSKPLCSRANKRLSERRIICSEYFTDKANIPAALALVNAAESCRCSAGNAVYTVAVRLLRQAGICEKQHAKRVLNSFEGELCTALETLPLPENERDLPGIIYQLMKTEGEKNRSGAYYTPQDTVVQMLDNVGDTDFLDCCCGSGSFLLSVNLPAERIYGCDTDKIAVFIAKVNLLLRFRDEEFEPHIVCADFIRKNPFKKQFGCIATNPPWGAERSSESFSEFTKAAYESLEDGGVMRLLLPSSALNVKAHTELRRFLLEHSLERITLCRKTFSGVQTDFIHIYVRKAAPCGKIRVVSERENFTVSSGGIAVGNSLAFRFLSPADREIIALVNSRKAQTLTESEWALGIVTGDNKNKLLDVEAPFSEPILTGKDVSAFLISAPKKFIIFQPENLQQYAAPELYRRKKLIYRFISERLVFAADDSGMLTLNSLNVLIPHLDRLSDNALLTLLNSDLYSFLYARMFGGVKILKGNLSQLPLPKLTETEDRLFSAVAAEKNTDEANRLVCDYFGITPEMKKYISFTLGKNR